MNLQELLQLKETALNEAKAAKNVQEIEDIRIKYLSRKGIMPAVMKDLRNVEPEERGNFGRTANELKNELTAILSELKDGLSATAADASDFDFTLPGEWQNTGKAHPISMVIDSVVETFSKLGFTVAEGQDIEDKYHNFEALNTPMYHPSLDQLDTFWFNDEQLLRTQTSPVQIRVMEETKPPVRIITPGRCYRRDTTDATHSANFHQIEGLYVDENVSLADLKSVLAYFAKETMGKDVKVRFRPHFFPFTEPSVECDFSCHVCGGKGCRVCKGSGWIEIAGAGMVDPRVFKYVGYEGVTGFAFGMGVERIAMIKYGIPDIRFLYENDSRFLNQF